MKKSEQMVVNEMCMAGLDEMMTEINIQGGISNGKRLRTCNAKVFETPNFYILQSYGTLVAFIDRRSDTLYDVLRYVYGYTATSSQHIAKFNHDYCIGNWGCANRYTYR